MTKRPLWSHSSVSSCCRVTVRPCVDLSAVLPYALYEQGARLAAAAGAKVRDTRFTDEVTLELTLLEGAETPLLEQFSELCRGKLRAQVGKPYYAPF